MPNQPTDSKFETFELLRHGQPYAVIPKFFFRLWQNYGELPDSWWKSLFYILNVTLGGSKAGIEGTLAYSELPVDSHQFKMFKAALDGYGRLIRIETAGRDSAAGSRFILDPEATEDDWITFHNLLSIAWRSRILTRRTGWGYEQVKEAFSKFAPRESQQRMPFWSLIMLRTIADEHCEFYKAAAGIDVWDDANWRLRGFDQLKLQGDTVPFSDVPEFADLSSAEWFVICLFFHVAWTGTAEHDHVPILPADPEELKAIYSKMNSGKEFAEIEASDEDDGMRLSNILAKFKTVTFDDVDGQWLESEWLTKLWQQAKADYELDSHFKKVAAKVAQPLIEGMEQFRQQLISRQKVTPKD